MYELIDSLLFGSFEVDIEEQYACSIFERSPQAHFLVSGILIVYQSDCPPTTGLLVYAHENAEFDFELRQALFKDKVWTTPTVAFSQSIDDEVRILRVRGYDQALLTPGEIVDG